MKLVLKVLVSVNEAAHRLAKMAGCRVTELVWLEEVPVRLKGVIDSDVPHYFFKSNFTHFSFIKKGNREGINQKIILKIKNEKEVGMIYIYIYSL